jgi:hypothetical protein
VAQQGQSVFGYPYVSVVVTTTPDMWLRGFDRPVAIPRNAPVGGQPFVPREATVDNTTTRVWPLTQGEKARPVVRVAAQGQHLFVPREATRENTANLVWPLTQGEKARPQPRWGPLGITPFVPREATVDNTIRGMGWWQPFGWATPKPPAKTDVIYPVQPVAFVDNTVTPDKWMMRWRGPPRYLPQAGWVTFLQRAQVTFAQSLSAEITVTVDLHVCGWGTAPEEGVAFVEQAEAGDVWTVEEEQTVTTTGDAAFQECGGDVAFQADDPAAFQVCGDVIIVPAAELIYTVQAEESDPWSEQGEHGDDWEEQDECGR